MKIKAIQKFFDYVFLVKHKVVTNGKVQLENRNNIQIGQKVSLGDKSRIRSRCDSAKVILGDSTKIREFVEINAKGKIVDIKANSFIARNTWIGGCGEISIGPNSMIGIGCVIVSSDHDYKNIKVPYYDNSEIPKPIFIGENVWIGAGSIVLGGSIIGSGSVVAAGSVVHGKFPDNCLIAGVPGEIKSKINRLDFVDKNIED